MKFDQIITDPLIADKSWKIEVGFDGPDTPYDEQVIQHTMIDGNIQIINIGNRTEKEAQFDIIFVTKSDFLIVEEWFHLHIGERIKVIEENVDEKLFTESFINKDDPITYFAKPIEIGDYQEENFSVTRELFRLRIKLAEPVAGSTDVFNPADIGNLNALIRVNTVQWDIKFATQPVDPESFAEGTRWFDTTANKVKRRSAANIFFDTPGEWKWIPGNDGTGILFPTEFPLLVAATYSFSIGDKIHVIDDGSETSSILNKTEGIFEIIAREAGNLRLANNNLGTTTVGITIAQPWHEELYTVPADDASVGFIDGIFYWAAFFTINKASFPTLTELEENYVSGVINHKSISIKGQSIEINSGPNVMTREGFSFSIDNSNKFHKFIVDNGIPLFGAEVILSIFRDTIGSVLLKTIMTGINKTNSFSYTDYKFQVEPFLLNTNQELPPDSSKISDDTEEFKNVRGDVIGKAPYLTYGEFDIGALQNISKERTDLLVKVFYTPYNMNEPEQVEQADEIKRITGSIKSSNLKVIVVSNKTIGAITDGAGYLFTTEQLNNINDNGGFTIKILFDSNVAGQANVDLVRQIDIITVVGDDYEILLTSDLEVVSPGGETIRFTIINSTYEFQYNTSPSGGFGTVQAEPGIADEFTPDDITLFYLSENNKDLIEIPPNNFSFNRPSKNKISFNLIGVNDPSQAINFSPIGKDILRQPLPRIFEPMSFDVIRPIGFTDGAGANIPTPSVFTGTNFQKAAYQFGDSPMIVESLANDANTDRNQHSFVGYEEITTTTLSIVQVSLRGNSQDFDSTLAPRFLSPLFQYVRLSGRMLDDSRVTGFEFPVSHFDSVDKNIPDNSTVVLGIHMTYQAPQITKPRWHKSKLLNKNQIDGPHRFHNEGMRLIMRVLLKDGSTIISDTGWEHNVPFNSTSAGSAIGADMGLIEINCMPGSDIVGDNFQPGVQLPLKRWDVDLDFVFETISERDTFTLGGNFELVAAGALALVKSTNTIYKRDILLTNEIILFKGTWSVFLDPVPDNHVFRIKTTTTSGSEPNFQENLTSIILRQWDSVAKDFTTLDPLTDSSDRRSSKISGRGMFDVSKLFTPTQDWPNVESFQFYFVAKDVGNNWNDVSGDIYESLGAFPVIKLRSGPKLYIVEDFDIEDRPLFSAIRGKTLPVGSPTSVPFPSTPEPIVKDIMETMFPGRTNLASITNLMSQSGRGSWLWRRQFTGSMSDVDVMQELMENLWAVIRLDENDKFEFVSLNIDDNNPSTIKQQFTDSTVLKDTVSNPKFRDSKDVFQRFKLNFNFDPVSEFSSSVKEFKNSTLMADDPASDANSRLKLFMQQSNILYNKPNIFERGYKYHYESGKELPMRDWIVVHYVFNAWTLKLVGGIDRILGDDALKVMDTISWKSFFHTGNELMKGFILKIEPDIYQAICVFTIFIQRPIGYLGPLCDPFNDALLTDRDTTSIPKNDSGITGRNTASFTKKDAGTSPRTIECE